MIILEKPIAKLESLCIFLDTKSEKMFSCILGEIQFVVDNEKRLEDRWLYSDIDTTQAFVTYDFLGALLAKN